MLKVTLWQALSAPAWTCIECSAKITPEDIGYGVQPLTNANMAAQTVPNTNIRFIPMSGRERGG